MNENTNEVNTTDTSKTMVPCPDCGTPLNIPSDVEVGDVIVCNNPECGAELEVVSVDPIEVDYLMIQK